MKMQKKAVIAPMLAILASFIIFNGCENKTPVSVTIPDTVTSIGEREYARKRLNSVEIPDGVTSIGAGAFQGNKLTSVRIPDSVKSIGVNAFADNPLTRISIGQGVTLRKEEVEEEETIFDDDYEDDETKSLSERAREREKKSKIVRTITYNDVLGHVRDGRDSLFNDYYYMLDKKAGTYTRPNTDTREWKYSASRD